MIINIISGLLMCSIKPADVNDNGLLLGKTKIQLLCPTNHRKEPMFSPTQIDEATARGSDQKQSANTGQTVYTVPELFKSWFCALLVF